MALPFMKQSVEDKVREKLIYDASKKKQKDAKEKAKKDNEEIIKKAEWLEATNAYEKVRDKAIDDIANIKTKYWENWSKKKKVLTDNKILEEDIKKAKDAENALENSEITDVIDGISTDITDYIKKAEELKPSVAKTLTYEGQVEYIKTQAEQKFSEKVATQMALAKNLAKLKALTANSQFDADKINQELSNIPLKLEEVIDSVKQTLDTLLGKTLAPIMTPDLPEFNPDAIIAQIKIFLNPVISSTSPLTAILGNIPIIGELMGLFQMLASGSGQSTLTKEEIMKLVPKKPEPDPTLMDKIKKIGEDILLFCMTLPTLLIDVIFAMIDVIYSKLRIITSVIPLGGMFPLNLLPAAIDAGPKIRALIKVLPGLVYDMVKGLVMDKLWEAMALAFPKPNLDADTLIALADDINEQKEKKKAEARKKLTYTNITKDAFENQLCAFGYTEMQVKNIQKNYLAIFNGTGQEEEKIKKYTDNGKEQNLPNQTLNSLGNAGASMLNSATDLVTFGAVTEVANANEEVDESEMVIGYDESEISRKKPSPEDYKAYLDGLIASATDLSVSLPYDRIKATENVVGEWYETYKEQLKSIGHDVVFRDEMKPTRLGTGSFIPQAFK